MSWIDWLIMLGTLAFITVYGFLKTRKHRNIEGYLRGDSQVRWGTIGLSVMATQASAITFLATPGLGYEKGMGFVQFYFGLPLAMIFISVFFIPVYHRLKIYTAYEFLESRFDLKTRVMTAFLFLIQRSLAAGITIYAPSIILSQIMGWNIHLTNLLIGGLVIAYTVGGGTKAVNQTHRHQMTVMFAGLILVLGLLLFNLPVGLGAGLDLAGALGKMKIIDLGFEPDNRYSLWSGILGGFFLQLSYFGTDQSQVQRYLGGSSVNQIRAGLLFNGILKIPMQFLILFIGVLVFVFYQFNAPPLNFNKASVGQVKDSEWSGEYKLLEVQHQKVFSEKKEAIQDWLQAKEGDFAPVGAKHLEALSVRESAKALLVKADPTAETNESNYVFIGFILKFLPVGVIGFLLAMIFSAAMSSTSAELNALAATTTVDLYKRSLRNPRGDRNMLLASRWFTLIWGLLAVLFATLATMVENLVEAVNILGSLFYPVILGVFLVAFFIRRISANAVFIAAIASEVFVMGMYWLTDIGFLWFNLIGVFMVVFFAVMLEGAATLHNGKQVRKP